jgi:hypothetical protein
MTYQKERRPGTSLRQFWQNKYPSDLAPNPKEVPVMQCSPQPWRMFLEAISKKKGSLVYVNASFFSNFYCNLEELTYTRINLS